MTGSNEFVCFLAWPLPETAMGKYVTVSRAPCHIHTITLGDTIVLLVRSKGYPPRTNDLTRPPALMTAETKNENNSYPGCLALTVISVLSSTDANPTCIYYISHIRGRAQPRMISQTNTGGSGARPVQ